MDDRLKLLAARLTDQENWYISWHLDILIVWALAKAAGEYGKGNYKQALELLGSDFNAFGYKVDERNVVPAAAKDIPIQDWRRVMTWKAMQRLRV
ncbi:hypothetical protein YC2023_109812 [Brassica napus]